MFLRWNVIRAVVKYRRDAIICLQSNIRIELVKKNINHKIMYYITINTEKKF